MNFQNKDKHTNAFIIDTDESAELFKTQIYSQTGVPPERQKIMVKGGILKV